MADQRTSKNGITPPKGRPTRARNGTVTQRRVFGSTAQWILVVFALTLIFITIVILVDPGQS